MITRLLLPCRWLGIVGVLGIGACTAEVPAPANYTVAIGQEFSIRLQTIGPGNPYDSIPGVSSATVRFLDMTEPDSLRNPGGPNQLYRFEAQVPGRVTIMFRKSGTSGVRSEIVEVR